MRVMPAADSPYDVFLSYNSEDHGAVEAVARELERAGLRVFLERWYHVAGRPWLEVLQAELGRCGAVAVFVGPHGPGRWQRRETALALDRQTRDPLFRVIPVLLPHAEPGLGFLELNTCVDLRTRLDDATALATLADAVRG